MPLIQVGAPKGAMNKEKQDVFMKKLSDKVLESEGAVIGYRPAHALVWAYYNEIEKASCYIGGFNVEKQPIYIKLTTPKGSISLEKRKKLSAEVQGIVNDAIGSYDGKLNYWLIFMEADKDTWGAAGDIFTLEEIQGIMNIKG